MTISLFDRPFFRVRAATVLPDGTLAVADAGNHRVALFSPGGEALASLGGEGEGPGEFLLLSGLASIGDTLIAYDGRQSRITAWADPTSAPIVA